MRAFKRPILLVVIAILLLPAPPLRAQVPFSLDDCDFTVVGATPASDYGAVWEVRHPDEVFARLKPDLDQGRWGSVATSMADAFRTGETGPTGEVRATFQAQLDAAAAELRAVEGNLEAIRMAQGVDQGRFHIDRHELLLFEATPHEIDLEAIADGSARRDLCWRAMAMQRVLTYYGEEGRDVAVQALRNMLARWDHYNANSYSQYPWELLINGLFTGRGAAETLEDLAPPSMQLVILHPGIALEASGFADGLDELRRLDVLAVEPLGLLFYNERRTSYVGISTVLSIPRDAGAGFGALLHLGRRAQLGFIYRNRESSGRGSGLLFSADLFGLLTGVPQSLREARDRVEMLVRTAAEP
jgi:hypothetical protein